MTTWCTYYAIMDGRVIGRSTIEDRFDINIDSWWRGGGHDGDEHPAGGTWYFVTCDDTEVNDETSTT